MFLKYLNVIEHNYIKQYKDALRFTHYTNYYQKTVVIWKMFLHKPNFNLKYKIFKLKSFYNRSKKFKSSKRIYLLNLYFFFNMVSYVRNIDTIQLSQFCCLASTNNVNSWDLIFKDNFDNIQLLSVFLQRGLFEQNILTRLYNKQWSKFKPVSWVSLKIFKLLDEDLFDTEFENYFILDGHNHYIQYKITFDFIQFFNFLELSKIKKNKKSTKYLQLWFIQVLLLRLLMYPVVFKYRYLPLLENLTIFEEHPDLRTENGELPWDKTLQEDGVWQFDDIAVNLVYAARALRVAFRRQELTETIMQECFEDLFSGISVVNKEFQKMLFNDRYIILYLLSRIKKYK